jgi:hypothetical protein
MSCPKGLLRFGALHRNPQITQSPAKISYPRLSDHGEEEGLRQQQRATKRIDFSLSWRSGLRREP